MTRHSVVLGSVLVAAVSISGTVKVTVEAGKPVTVDFTLGR